VFLILILTFISYVCSQGFIEEDLFVFEDGTIREELVPSENDPETLYFRVNLTSLQVTPISVQTRNADFSFVFNLFRDIGEKEAWVVFNFFEYFEQLEKIGETESGFNRTLHESYINDGNINMTCYPLRYFKLEECTILPNNFELLASNLVGYYIKREDSGNQFFYKWDEIGLVIKNLPVLPYVIESKPIRITIYDPDRGVLA